MAAKQEIRIDSRRWRDRWKKPDWKIFWGKGASSSRERKGAMGEREGKQSERKDIGKFNWDDESGEVAER